MNKTVCLAFLPLLAACGGDAGAEGERKGAAGEVLGGTISDDMLPLDTVTSQSPPLREKGEGGPSANSGEDDTPTTDTSPPEADEAAPEPAAEPAPTATPESEE